MGKLELQHFRKMQCHYTLLDQYGNIVCMKNFEAPGDCDTLHCPYRRLIARRKVRERWLSQSLLSEDEQGAVRTACRRDDNEEIGRNIPFSKNMI